MGIRIEQVTVRRNGPLAEDFEMEPGDLNLIYGLNETGKTYLLEAMLRFLFTTGSGTPWSTASRGDSPADVRQFPLAGRALVSVDEDERVSFEEKPKTKNKLDDLYAPALGLPGELSRMVVVRAGRTRLSGDSRDGVGRETLAAILGGGDVLDDIAGRRGMPQYSSMHVSGRSLAGNMERARKENDRLRQRLRRLEELQERVAENASAVRLTRLRGDLDEIEAEIEKMELARAARAHRLGRRRKELKERLAALPSDGELSELRTRIRILQDRKREREENRKRAAGLDRTEENFRWLEKAAEVWEDCVTERDRTAAGPGWMPAVAALLVAVAVAAGLRGIPWLSVPAGMGGVALILVYGKRVMAWKPTPQQTAEQERIAGEYAGRFGAEPAGAASLRSRLEALRDERVEARSAARKAEDLEDEIRKESREIEDTFLSWLPGAPPADEWEPTIEETMEEVRSVEGELGDIRAELSGLAPGDDLPPAPRGEPEVDYDRGVHEGHMDRRREIKGRIDRLNSQLSGLAGEIVRMADAEGGHDWERLLDALRRARDETLAEYCEQTAEVLAGIAVQESVSELKEKEMERIAGALSMPVVRDTLEQLTGRYDGVRLEEDGTLTLAIEGEYDYPLEMLSTGAREQVFLALRSSFAELTFGQPAFLLLDDAFQHSDWQRRRRLVIHCLKLIDRGWQIFYFCMDDHIRDLFNEQDGKLGDRYRKVYLEAAT